MNVGDRLRIYKRTLENKNNQLRTRFKLVKLFKDNEHSHDLYYGLRVDNRTLAENSEESDATRDFYTVDDLVVKPSIFIKLAGSKYFCDALDNYRVCTLIEDNSSDIHHGCCDILKISPKELVKFNSKRLK